MRNWVNVANLEQQERNNAVQAYFAEGARKNAPRLEGEGNLASLRVDVVLRLQSAAATGATGKNVHNAVCTMSNMLIEVSWW